MALVNSRSLGSTLDALIDRFLRGMAIANADRRAAASFIASRQGEDGSYRGMFAPTELDFKLGYTLYTGEVVSSGASTAHVLSEESLRALVLLNIHTRAVNNALDRASDALRTVLKASEGPQGFFCCGTCSAALWRFLSLGVFEGHEELLAGGVKELKAHRDGKGRWRRFPFYYTLLALGGIDLPAATGELKYAAPAVERALKSSSRHPDITARRHLLCKAVLAKV